MKPSRVLICVFIALATAAPRPAAATGARGAPASPEMSRTHLTPLVNVLYGVLYQARLV